jgi:hypothetical protein
MDLIHHLKFQPVLFLAINPIQIELLPFLLL